MVIRNQPTVRAEPGNRELDSGNGIQCGYQLSCDGKCDLLGYAEQPESGRVQGAGKRCSCLEWLFVLGSKGVGGLKDWLQQAAGIPGITIEVGRSTCPVFFLGISGDLEPE